MLEFVLPLAFGILAAVYWRRQKRGILRGFGLVFDRRTLPDVLTGFLISLVAMAGIFLCEWALGVIRVTGTHLNLSGLAGSAGTLIFGAVLEELLFRSLLLSGLLVLVGQRRWPAILISAAFFGFVHLGNPGATYIGAFGNALGGVIYGLAFLGSGRLWLPLGLHFGWNFVQGPLLGFPVSGTDFGGLVVQEPTGSSLINGGPYGPEAGLVGIAFRFVIMAMLAYVLRRLARDSARDPV